MGFHHVAIATQDTQANHRFYTDCMGFRLVKVVAGKSPDGGWSKHLFYDTGGGGLIAFWELHEDSLPEDWSPAISTGLGLPGWTNHLAFDARDLDEVARARERWLAHGHDVVEIDHGWCTSIYANDPNGIMVEWCTTTREFSESDIDEAERLLNDPHPSPEAPPSTIVHRAKDYLGSVS